MSDRSILHSLAVTLADADAVPDAELLRRYADSSDAVAFELLVRRHAELVWSVCRSVHPTDHQTAEDAFQATFVALARKAVSVRDPSAAGWLFRVARNAAARAKRRPHAPLPDDVSANTAPDRTETAEVARIVSEEVDRLSAKFREPVLLCFYEGFSHAQAAERLGWAVGTVASRLARAKDRLRDRLTRRGVTLPALGAGVLAGTSAPAAVIRSTVSGAIGNTTDAVRKLSTEVLRSMTTTKLKLTAVMCAAAMLLGGVGTAVAWQAHRDDKKVKVKGAKAKPADDDLKKLQGKWKVVRMTFAQAAAPDDAIKGMTWEFDGNKLFGRSTQQPNEAVSEFTIDTTKSPKQIDTTMTGMNTTIKSLGIYEYEGNKLRICQSLSARPTEFAATGKDCGVIELEKADEKKVDKPADPETLKKQAAAFQAEFDALQGEWKITSTEFAEDVGGEKRTKAPNGAGFVIRGHEVRMTNAKPGEEDKDTLLMAFDHTATPKQMNLTAVVAPQMVKGKVMPGIYEIKDGKLTLCFGEPSMGDKNRPTAFKADKEKRVTVLVLEKKK